MTDCPLTKSMMAMAQRIDYWADQLPDDSTDLEESYPTILNNIRALEAEWIVDPNLREELSRLDSE